MTCLFLYTFDAYMHALHKRLTGAYYCTSVNNMLYPSWVEEALFISFCL